jgi:hypothetical protein
MTEESRQSMLEACIRVAERFGVPVVLLAVGIWMTREAAIAIHSSVVEPVVKSHVEFLEATKETMHQQADTLQELATGQREIQQVLARPANTQGAN